MNRKVILRIMLSMVIVSTLTIAFNFLSVKAQEPPIEVLSDYTLDRDITFAGDGFIVEVDYITLDLNGYIITGSGTGWGEGTGVNLTNVRGVTVKNGEIRNFYNGIYLFNSTNITITNNTAIKGAGIVLDSSNNNTISGNDINDESGIVLDSSNNNSVSGNNITNNADGIWLEHSTNNNISGNIIRDNTYGIHLSESSNNVISENNVTTNTPYGIWIASSSSNTVTGNNIANNNDGIHLSGPNDSSNNNIYHNNFLHNGVQVSIAHQSANVWEDGYPSGGNYWSDYTGVDADSDGIGDNPYVIDAYNQDNYPLMTPWSSAVTLAVHNIDTGLDYATIQEAIDAIETLDGHTIHVDAGTYYEHVIVDKSVSLIGENRENTIIDGDGIETVIQITSDGVTIAEFTIKNSGGVEPRGHAGIRIESNDNNGYGIHPRYSSNNHISENNITDNYHGLNLWECSNNMIYRNTITSNSYYGIYLRKLSNNNWIYGNNITNNQHGIYLYDSSNYNIILQNDIKNNKVWGGIILNNVTSNSISSNTIENNQHGITLELGAHTNSITGNTITNSDYYGLCLLADSYDNIISENEIANNNWGIKINTASDNSIFHNNFIDNANQAMVEPGDINMWDNGYPSGGNYWSDHDPEDKKSGPNQDVEGSDGIGDAPYVIDQNNEDRYPLTIPYGWVSSPDINKDGFVDVYDIVILAIAFGSYPGYPDWNPLADVNNDRVIDIFDAVSVAKYFGSTWPPPTS